MIEDCDRQAAEDLRIILADMTGFWLNPGDEGPLCRALERHRIASERRMLTKLLPWMGGESAVQPQPPASAIIEAVSQPCANPAKAARLPR